MPHPNPRRLFVVCSAALVGPFLHIALFAQNPTAAASAGRDDAVQLSAFTVTGTAPTGYATNETLAGGRVRTSILALPQSVTVVNRQLIDDIGAFRLIDAAKYVSGVNEGTIPNVVERYTMRGLQGANTLMVDGFIFFDQANTDLALIDRLEVVKGPSSLLFANGPVGGLISQITKSPLEKEHRRLKLQLGLFDSNRAEVDLTGPVNTAKSVLCRLVASYQDTDGFWDDSHVKRWVIAPSVTFRFSKDAQLTLKPAYEFDDTSGYTGIGWDLGTNAPIAVAPERNFSAANRDTYFKNYRASISAILTSRLNEVAQTKVAARMSSSFSPQYNLAGNAGAPFNSRTGSTTFALDFLDYKYRDEWQTLQNDWLLNYGAGPVKFETSIGTEARRRTLHQNFKTYARFATVPVAGSAKADLDPLATAAPARANNTATEITAKIYALQQATMLDDRLVLSLGAVQNFFKNENLNNLTGVTTANYKGSEKTIQYGALFRATKTASFYYAYNENFQVVPPTATAVLPNTFGEQHEFGVKAFFLDEKLRLTAAHYDIKITNATQASLGPTGVVVVSIPSNKSKGYELDLAATLARNLDAIIAFSSLDPVDGNGRLLRGATKTVWSALAKYRLEGANTKGWAVSAGASHMGSRAGNFGDTFRLPSVTTINLGVFYTREKWKLSLQADNVTDEDYVAGSLNTARVYMAPGRNVRAAVEWSF